MKRIICKCLLLKTFLFLSLSLVLVSFHAIAQDQYYPGNSEAGKSYWRIFTNYQTRSTIIRFFDANRQLIYEEVVAGKYIKLTKKNIRLLDQTLALLAGNHLVASTVKSNDLWAENLQPASAIPASLLGDELKESKQLEASGLRLNTHQLVNRDKLEILLENPQKERVLIVLRNEDGMTVYEERTFLTRYRRILNLFGMDSGRYTIEIKSHSYNFSREIALSYRASHYSLQPLPDTIHGQKQSFLPF